METDAEPTANAATEAQIIEQEVSIRQSNDHESSHQSFALTLSSDICVVFSHINLPKTEIKSLEFNIIFMLTLYAVR